MRRRLLVGQLVCFTTLLVLTGSVPFLPRVWGLPPHRVAEMGLFWTAQWSLVLGMGLSLHATDGAPSNGTRILAAVGVLIALAVCWLALTNLLYSSLWGAGMMGADRPGRLFPKELGYALAVPLLLATASQLPMLLLLAARPPATPPRQRTGRLVLQLLLLLLFLLAGVSGLIFFVERWFAVVTVGLTWLAGPLFLALGVQQVFQARSRSDEPTSDREHATSQLVERVRRT